MSEPEKSNPEPKPPPSERPLKRRLPRHKPRPLIDCPPAPKR